MDLLLDTHALIWFINGDKQLPDKSVKRIKNINNKCFVSIASIWEIAIKISLGKLELNGGFDEISNIMTKYKIELLPISFEHVRILLTLEFHHRDPFDRILISQVMVEQLSLVSKDDNCKKYNIDIVWN